MTNMRTCVPILIHALLLMKGCDVIVENEDENEVANRFGGFGGGFPGGFPRRRRPFPMPGFPRPPVPFPRPPWPPTPPKPTSKPMISAIGGISKDYKKTDSERRAQLKSFLDNTQDGDCLDALDTLTGGSSDLYGCFKEAYNKVEQAYCEPPRVHGEALGALQDIDASAGVVKAVTGTLKNIPKVGAVAKIVYDKMRKVEDILRPRIERLEKMKEQPHGEEHEDSGCCQPFPKASKFPFRSCSASPGASYKCGTCSRGEMCNMQKGCNSVRKVEEKLDRYFDDFVLAFSEAAKAAQAGENAANKASWLWDCKSVSNKCSSLKKVAKDVTSKIRSVHDKLKCPWNFDLPSLPNLDPLKEARDVLNEIKKIFDKINDILGKKFCFPVPTVEMQRQCLPVPYVEMRRQCVNLGFKRVCTQVPVPTTKTVCTDIPVPTVSNECFSAKMALEGLNSALRAIPGVREAIQLIEKLLDEALRPVHDLLGKLLNKITPDVNFNLPNLPSFDFSLPNLPQMTCASLK